MACRRARGNVVDLGQLSFWRPHPLASRLPLPHSHIFLPSGPHPASKMAASAVSCASVAVVLPSTRALRPATAAKRVPFVSNGSMQKTSCMMVWTPINNK